MIAFDACLAALLIGLLGGAHCVGMCGGIIGALSVAGDPGANTGAGNTARAQKLRWLLLYNLGRLGSYVCIGLLFYLLVDSIEDYFALQFMRYIAGFILIAMGLYVANWWRGLAALERLGHCVWRYLQPCTRSLLPVRDGWQALALGGLWGWLPCGLIYSALTYAATVDSPVSAGAVMLAFGIGTLPAVMTSGLFAQRLLLWVQREKVRCLFAVVIMAFGVWTLYGAFAHGGGSDHHAKAVDHDHPH